MLGNIVNNVYYFLNGPAKLLKRKVCSRGFNKVAIYGAGEIGEALLSELAQASDVEIVAIFDRKAEYLPCEINGRPISPPSDLSNLDINVPVVIASEAFIREIEQTINQHQPNAITITTK